MKCTCAGKRDDKDAQKTYKEETTCNFYLLNEVFVNEAFVKCELKVFHNLY